MNRRVIGLVVAVLLAAIATAALYFYVQRADERAQEDVQLRQVYVATQQIEAGTAAEAAITQGLVQQREIPANAVAQGAIGSLDQIEGLVATVPIVPGQQIVTANFDETAAVATGTDIEVPEGLQAVSIDLGVLPGVAGFVNAGDRLSIISLINQDTGAAPAEGEEAAPAEGLTAQYFMQDALVLAVGQRVTNFDENGNATGRSIRENNENYIFTLALTPEQIERLVFAETQTQLWASLQPDREEDEEFDSFDTPGANLENLFQ